MVDQKNHLHHLYLNIIRLMIKTIDQIHLLSNEI